MKSFIKILLPLLSVLLVSCGKEEGRIRSIRFPEGEPTTVYQGHTIKLDPILEPSGADPSALSWSSSAEGIATVVSGYVTGVTPGSATITASCGKHSASVYVQVLGVDVESFSIGSGPFEVGPGGDVDVPVSDFKPDYANANNVLWAIVDNGNCEHFSVSGVQADKVTVHCDDSAKDGYVCELYGRNKDNSFHRSVQIHTVHKVLEQISFSPSSCVIQEGESKEINCVLTPYPTVPFEIQYSSSDNAIATVAEEDGKVIVTGVAVGGPVTITAKDRFSGISGTCSVSVFQKREIKPDCRIGLYRNYNEVIRDRLYSVSDPIGSTTETVLPCKSSNMSFIVGLDDGYALCGEDLEVTLSTTGSIISQYSQFNNDTPYMVNARIEQNNASGSVTVRIPNGSSATLSIQTRISTFSMEKQGAGGFTAFASNATTVPVGGTFTITRPSSGSDRYQFCVNSGSSPVRDVNDRDIMISNWYSWNTYITGFNCAALRSNGALDDMQFLTVRSTTPTGTYEFVHDDPYFPAYDGFTYKVVIK